MTTQENRQFVVDNVGKMTAMAMQKALESTLTPCQANNVVRNQRVKLGVYKNAFLDSTHADYASRGTKPGTWAFKGGSPIKKVKVDKSQERVREF